jgi:hypothetical protein
MENEWKLIVNKKGDRKNSKANYMCGSCGEACRYDRLKNHKCSGYDRKRWTCIDQLLLARLLELIVGLKDMIKDRLISYLVKWFTI